VTFQTVIPLRDRIFPARASRPGLTAWKDSDLEIYNLHTSWSQQHLTMMDEKAKAAMVHLHARKVRYAILKQILANCCNWPANCNKPTPPAQMYAACSNNLPFRPTCAFSATDTPIHVHVYYCSHIWALAMTFDSLQLQQGELG
jgi:hypothetical protein